MATSPIQSFLQEAQEVLEALETRLLELEADPANGELVDAVFRSLHTLKGSGEMFGFTALAAFTHSFETAYDAVRDGRSPVTQALIDVSLRARDHIQTLVDAGTDAEANARLREAPEGRALLQELEALTAGGAAETGADAPADPEPPGAERETAWRIRFRPARDALRNGTRPDILIEELARLGHAEARCIAREVPPLGEIDPAGSYLAWDVRLVTAAGRQAIEDVFIFADEGELEIEVETDGAGSDGPAPEPGARTAAPPTPEESAPPPGGTPRAAAKGGESVRVQSERLDTLMDQLGELVIAQARLNRISHDLANPGLVATAEEIERLITGLRDATLSIRMQPIGGVFGKFRRLVRDLSNELGKDVSLVTEGGETELDKNVIDGLSEPLVHIIRNAVDHGIESADRRAGAGKPAAATVRMAARQSGGEVLITVGDDGGGLDTDAIRRRAVERGVIGADDALSEAELQQLIFAPGFSTAESVSNVSGRGVGMDAVRSVVTDLGGDVEVRSALGEGTEVTLRLPLTLAIIEGLLVRVAGDSFVLPLSSVDECVDLGDAETRRESGRAILTIRDELVPFIDLGAVFGLSGGPDAPPPRKIVIVRTEKRRVGLLLDDIVGQHQTVIKSLSLYHRDIPGLAGGTILGDGSVALILDPPALARSAATQPMEAA